MAPRALALVVATCVTVGLTGCAGCGGSTTSDSRAGAPHRGGVATVLSQSDVDTLDPGRANLQFTSMLLGATQRTLYRYEPGRTGQQPDLASGPPVVSADGRQVTVHIRRNVRFAPPLTRTVHAADVRYAIERAFRPAVANGYAATYFGSVLGLQAFEKGKTQRIAGIRTPDDRTLVFHLRRPEGAVLAHALVMSITAPVPREYAARFDHHSPSTYATHAVATGPYMVSRYRPGEEIDLARNPHWDADTDSRPAYLDHIAVRVVADAGVASRQILAGDSQLSGSLSPPPAVTADALDTRSAQVRLVSNGSTSYLALNTRIPPLNRVDVRRAVVAAFDRTGLLKASGGVVGGRQATHFLPPTVPGFDQAGGAAGPGFDFLGHATGSQTVADRYLREAGSSRSRLHSGPPLFMVGSTDRLGRGLAEIAQAQLERLGFRVDLHLAAPEAVATKFCTIPSARVAVCPSWGWQPDFPDGQAMLEPPFGSPVAPGSPNISELGDAPLRAAMHRAAVLADPGARARAWGAIDRRITALAPAVPGVWSDTADLRSSNVVAAVNPATALWDLPSAAIR